MTREPPRKRGEPPPREAGWLAILSWAAPGAIEPEREDVDLALKVWSGRCP